MYSHIVEDFTFTYVYFMRSKSDSMDLFLVIFCGIVLLQ